MQYTFLAVGENGLKQKGLLEANNRAEVVSYLRDNRLTPITISEVHHLNIPFMSYFSRITSSDIVIFTRQLSSMIQTGLTLIESLTILKNQATKPALRSLILDLIASISAGNSLSTALSYHKDVFSDVYIALIKAAETGGVMDKVLARLAENLEKSEDLRKHIRSAMFYPLIVGLGVMAVIVIMNVFVIPQLSQLYEGLDVELPLITRIVLNTSKAFTMFFPVVIILIVVGVVLFRRFAKTPQGHELIDTYKLKLPVMGGILKLSIEDEIARTLSLLISSGTSMLESLSITANVANNYVYKRAVVASATLVEKGINLSTAFEQQNIFPPILIQMTKVGESTGKIDESLGKVSEYFERDLGLKIRTLTTAIEPILLLFLGVTVGFLIISVISPIYSIISSIQ